MLKTAKTRQKKLYPISIFLIILIFFNLVTPMNSTAQLSTAPEITVNRFRLSGFGSLTGEYANETQVITVEVENTGNEYLKDIVVSCEIFRDPGLTTLEMDLGQNLTASLEVGEIMEFEFWSWTPIVADPKIATSFWFNITATGAGFKGMMDTDIYPVTEIVIHEVTIIEWVYNMTYYTRGTIMTPHPYVEGMVPNLATYDYSAAVHTAQFNIINLGNVEATNVVVDVDGYDISSATPWVSMFNDQETVVSLMPWTATDWTDFSSNTWDLTALVADGQLNLTVSSGADYLPPNATHYFEVADFYDVKPMMLTTDLVEKFGTVIFNTTAQHDFTVQIVNSGNQLINADFWARLNATEWSASAYGAEYDFGYQMIDGATTNLNPGDASQEVWAGIAPPGLGIYQFNVTAPGKDPGANFPNDYNATNNQTSISLLFQDTEGVNIDMITPSKNSKWPVMGMPIKVAVSNQGTLDFEDLGGCEVSLMIYDNNETMADTSDDILLWYPANVTIPGLEMTMTDSTSAKWTWTGAEGGKEYLVVVNATVGTSTIERSVTIKFPHPNGTVAGVVTIPANTAGIEIKAWDGTTHIKTTTTDATGYYVMSLEAIERFYNITLTAPYGFYDAYNDSVLVLDDKRITVVNFDLYPTPPTGAVNGTITLIEVGMPDPALDYTNIIVAVKGTPLWVNPDADGNYFIPDVVSGIVNVTVTMQGFTPAWNDSVPVLGGEITEYVDFILTEDWDVIVSPAHEAIDVAVDTVITVTFEEEINISSVNLTNTFELTDSSVTSIAGHIVWVASNKSFMFLPDANLIYGEEYMIWLCSDITNLTGVEVLHRDWESTFVTYIIDPPYWIKGYVTDAWNGDPIEGVTVTAGTAIALTDATGAYTLTIGAGIYDVTASKPLYEDDTVTGVYVVAAVATENINLTLTPIVNIDVIVIVGGVETAVEPESEILADVDNNTTVVMEFAEPINTTALDFFVLKDSIAYEVVGSVEWDAVDMTVTFTPDENLTQGETYILTIMDTVETATDAPILPRDVNWQFETYFMWCPPIPEITPRDGAIEVPLDAEVKIDFGCEMNTALTEAAITAAFGTGFSWDMYNQTVTIMHDDFVYDTEYTVSVSGNAQTIGGYYLLHAYSSTFRTELGPKEEHKQDLIVIDKNGSGIADVVVTIQDENGNTIWVGSTDSNGSLIIILASGLQAGNYTIYLQKDGYKDLIFTVEVNETGHILLPQEPVSMGIDDLPRPEEGKTDDDETFVNYVLVIGIIITIIIIVIILALALKLKTRSGAEETSSELRADELRCENCGAIISDLTYCEYCGWSHETRAESPEKLEEEPGSDEEE